MSNKISLGSIMVWSKEQSRKDCFNAGLSEGKKQGALEELKRIQDARARLIDRLIWQGHENYIENRIKELEGYER